MLRNSVVIYFEVQPYHVDGSRCCTNSLLQTSAHVPGLVKRRAQQISHDRYRCSIHPIVSSCSSPTRELGAVLLPRVDDRTYNDTILDLPAVPVHQYTSYQYIVVYDAWYCCSRTMRTLVLVIGERMSDYCWQPERLQSLSYIVESYDTLLRNDALRIFCQPEGAGMRPLRH